MGPATGTTRLGGPRAQALIDGEASVDRGVMLKPQDEQVGYAEEKLAEARLAAKESLMKYEHQQTMRRLQLQEERQAKQDLAASLEAAKE